MRHRRDIRLIAALFGLLLAGSFPALAAKPQTKPPEPKPPENLRLESERRTTPAEIQGQKGYWVEYEEYTYRYDPWPEELLTLYKELFNVDTSLDAMAPFIQRIHRGEMTPAQGQAAIRALHQALSANVNNPYHYYVDFEKQPIEFELIDKYCGGVWQGPYDDKRKTMALIYAKGHYDLSAYKRARPITASTFAEVSRLVRIIESIDLGIPIPVSTLRGEVLGKQGAYDASGQPYSLSISRESLVAKMQELYAVGINLDPNLTRPRKESDYSPYGAMNGAPSLPPLD